MNLLHNNALSLINPFKVTSADTDMFARIRLGALVNLLIQSAINSADKLDFGYSGLQKQQLFWVLNRLTIEIERPLKWYEDITIETWPKNVEKILYLRDYIVRDKNNKLVAKATSGWLAIDFETKRPKKIDGLSAEMFTFLKDKHAINKIPEKIISVNEGERFEFKSSYFDVDLNGHVTSSRYVDWMMDTFPIAFHEKNYPKMMVINYNKEILPDGQVSLIKRQFEPQCFQFDGNNTSRNSNIFRGKIIF